MASLLDHLQLVWTWLRGFRERPASPSPRVRPIASVDRPEGFAAVDRRAASRQFHVPGRDDREIVDNLLVYFVCEGRQNA